MPAFSTLARVAIYVLAVTILALSARALQADQRWRRPWAGIAPGVIGVDLLIFVQARGRIRALDDGPLPEVWPTMVTAAAMLILIVWLGRYLSFTPPWRRHRTGEAGS